MSNNLTLADAIVAAKDTGRQPAQLDALETIVSGATLASGTTVANITDASVAHDLNATFDDVEVEAALDALGAKINLLIAALEEFNISSAA